MSAAGRMPLSVMILLTPLVAGLGVMGMTFVGGQSHPAVAFGLVGLAVVGGISAIVFRVTRRPVPRWLPHPIFLLAFGLPGTLGASWSIERYDERTQRAANPEFNASLRPRNPATPSKQIREQQPEPPPPKAPRTFSASDHVDPDCYGDGFVCAKKRAGDAEALATAIKDVVVRDGDWCFDVMYVSGDRGEKDAIALRLCNHPISEFRTIGEGVVAHLKKNNRKLLRNVDLLFVTDGEGAQIELTVSPR